MSGAACSSRIALSAIAGTGLSSCSDAAAALTPSSPRSRDASSVVEVLAVCAMITPSADAAAALPTYQAAEYAPQAAQFADRHRDTSRPSPHSSADRSV